MSKNSNRGRRQNSRPDGAEGAPEVLTPEELAAADEGYMTGIVGPDFVPNSLCYNLSGVTPVLAEYRIPMTHLKKMFLEICQTAVSDVDSIIAQYDDRTGDVLFYARFVENSSHFFDGSLAHTAIADAASFSIDADIKKFAVKFGMDPKVDLMRNDKGEIINRDFAKNSRTKKSGGKDAINTQFLFVPNTDGAGNRLRSYSMRLSCIALLKVIFDQDGSSFKAKYGKVPPKCVLKCHFDYAKVRREGDKMYGEPRFLVITKESPNGGSGTATPVTNFRYKPV